MNIHNHHLSLRIIKCEMLSRALENSSSLLNSLFTTCYYASIYPTIFFWQCILETKVLQVFLIHLYKEKRTKTGITETCRNLLKNEQTKIQTRTSSGVCNQSQEFPQRNTDIKRGQSYWACP